MGRLIDEDDVLKVLCRELCHPGAICPDGYCEEVRERLKDVPTIHPEQPKIGKWIKNGNKYTCPFCGTGFTTVSEEVRSAHKYCYYCGAKMEDADDR